MDLLVKLRINNTCVFRIAGAISATSENTRDINP